jgi:glycosyltransferase involved in cell wall biosynthesis
MSGVPLTVLVTTQNEAANVGACLESVAWAADRLVVDSGSTDGTQAIAERAGARVLTHPYESAARQKNWALDLVGHPWVLILDADERVTSPLAEAIRAVVAADGPRDGYFLRRRSFFLGHPIHHCGWDRDRVLRLFRAGHGRYDDRRVHELLQLDGSAGEIGPPLLHYTYRSFRDYLDKLDRYTERGADDLRAAGRRPALLALLVRPPARFLRMYVAQRGFLDGVPGFLLCALAAGSVWLKYARLFEPPGGANDAPAGGASPVVGTTASRGAERATAKGTP